MVLTLLELRMSLWEHCKMERRQCCTAAELAHKGIKWKFNPHSAAHQVGIGDRLVRCLKRTIHTIFVTHRLSDEVLNTFFCLSDSRNTLSLIFFYLVIKQQKFRQSFVSTSSIIVKGTYVRSRTLTLFVQVGSYNRYRRWSDVPSGGRLPRYSWRPVTWFGYWTEQHMGLLPYCSDHWTRLRFRLRRTLCRFAHVQRIALSPACIIGTHIATSAPEDVTK